ncbi:alpha/beta fold hydrolase [Psychrosphaera haliotis]|uniref:alpha/beta fold hydrolase n=1 Tax=Psychrosphaera haliotis TaxID=555083 RepID=UPI0018C4F4F4|nr:alpha/beta hydrolase [Psychrosphaera haliotis]
MKSHFIKISGGEVAALKSAVFDSNTAPTIIALHGWLDNAASFTPLINALPQFNWIAIDLPGHGHSFHRANNSYYHFIDWVSDVIEVIDALNLPQPPILVGHSLGGMLGTVLAGLYPDKISKLILIDSAGLVIQDDANALVNIRAAMNSRLDLVHKKPRHHEDINAAIKARQKAGGISLDSAKILVERNTELKDGGYRWRTDIRLRTGSPVRVNLTAAQQIIAAIEVKTLIILATDGYESMQTNYSKFQSFYRNHKMVEVSGSHHCHLDDPSETSQQIAEFLL